MRSIATLAAILLPALVPAPASAATPFVDSIPRASDTGPVPTPRGAALSTRPDVLPVADRVLVRKGERRLFLKRQGTVLRSYRVALGLNPVGHKEREGDFRTPEGQYRLVRRNPRSDFFLSMQVSYPDDDDLRRARRNGWAPGGAIMIHGLPNDPRRDLDYYSTQDWTDGCIAVSNSDMLEIWMLVPDGTPIEIRP
jgi:murein L,D-transpeptidase YafK